MEPQPGWPSSPGTPSPETAELPAPLVVVPPSDEPEEEVGVKPDRQSSSSSSSSSSSEAKAEKLFHSNPAETIIPLVVAASADDEAVASGDIAVVRTDDEAVASGDVGEVKPDDEVVASGDSTVVRPDDWASWPQQPAQTDGGTVLPGLTTQAAPEVQTMAQPAAEPAAAAGFDPERIPASIFQAKPLASSSSQAEWSVASNESLFSIHGARPSTDLCGFYAGESRSHFDYFYDEAMAAVGGADQPPDWKLATVAEGSPAGSARSDASGGARGSGDRAKHKAAIAFHGHESGSAGSSSNFSFAFPILPETTTSPRKREYGGGSMMYQPLQKELEQPPLVPSPASAFEEMTTEEERRRRTSWCCCCGECCGCCWFACSLSSCCCCCRWRWWWCSRCNCDCRCSCPTLCRCNWCLCF